MTYVGWAVKLAAVYEIRDALAGSYTDEGVMKWWDRRRSQLHGLTPFQWLAQAKTEEDVAVVVDLARALEAGQVAT